MKKNSGMSIINPKWRNVKVTVTVKRSGDGLLTSLVRGGVEGIEEFVGKTLVLELVSNDLDSSTFFILLCIYPPPLFIKLVHLMCQESYT